MQWRHVIVFISLAIVASVAQAQFQATLSKTFELQDPRDVWTTGTGIFVERAGRDIVRLNAITGAVEISYPVRQPEAVLMRRNGDVLISTGSGFTVYAGGNPTAATNFGGVFGIRDMHEGRDGRVYILSTATGLVRMAEDLRSSTTLLSGSAIQIQFGHFDIDYSGTQDTFLIGFGTTFRRYSLTSQLLAEYQGGDGRIRAAPNGAILTLENGTWIAPGVNVALPGAATAQMVSLSSGLNDFDIGDNGVIAIPDFFGNRVRLYTTNLGSLGTGTPPAFALRGSLSGSWFNPQRSGEGFLVEVGTVGARNVLFVAWFTYFQGGDRWIIGSADFSEGASKVTIPMIIGSGTGFGSQFNASQVRTTPWGDITVEFTSCNAMRVDYSGGGEAGTLTLERLLQGGLKGVPCQ